MRNASRSVMSASSCWVTCGIVVQLLTRFGPESFLIRESSTRSVRSPGAACGARRGARGASPDRLLEVLLGDPPLAAGALDRARGRSPSRARAGARPGWRTAARRRRPRGLGRRPADGSGASSVAASASASTAVSTAPGVRRAPWTSRRAPSRGRGAVAAARPRSSSSSVPCATLSPTLTLSSCTTPANGAGTSIVALSDSSVTSGSSSATVSPGGDQHLDHGYVVEVPDVGDRRPPSPPPRGLRVGLDLVLGDRLGGLVRRDASAAPRARRSGGRPRRTRAASAASRCGRSRPCRARCRGRARRAGSARANARM